MTDPQPEAHYEQFQEGKHVDNLTVEDVSLTQARFILRGATRARLTDFLTDHPLAALTLHALSSRFTTGQYTPDTRALELNTARAGRTFGRTEPIGRVAAVSAWGTTKEEAMQMSFVHELGHHLLERHPPAFELALAAARRLEVSPVSLRARFDWQEHFCETLTAFTFFRMELMRHDPVGHKMVQELHATLRR